MLLISATPSPFARKVRIALIEKGIEFSVQNEVPWHAETATPIHNPLEQLPILVPDEGEPVYESSYILEWIEEKYPQVPLLPPSSDGKLEAKRIQVIAEGVMDAGALLFFEGQREHPSSEWTKRQLRKIAGGLGELNRRLGQGQYFVGDKFGLADISAIAVLGMQDVVEDIGVGDQWRAVEPTMIEWRKRYPNLRRFEEQLRERPSVRDTAPIMFDLTQAVV